MEVDPAGSWEGSLHSKGLSCIAWAQCIGNILDAEPVPTLSKEWSSNN